MKLNYKRTILVGMAFFLIMAFWQAYDAIVPLILNNHFGLPHWASGMIMSVDNVLAVFLLPLFGALSDKVVSKHGKRTPFILVGTVAAAISFVFLAVVDLWQFSALKEKGILDTLAQKAENVTESDLAIVRDMTLQNITPLITFIGVLLILLVAMAIFRSPAVALMPDVTVKPLRSKANAVINLTGTAGGILVLILGKIFGTSDSPMTSYLGYVLAVVGIMLVGLTIFLATVREKKWAAEMETEEARLEPEKPADAVSGERPLTRAELRSLLLILASVALWYIGYNAITTKYSIYATTELHFDFNLTLLIAQAAAIVAYIPVGIISSKVGRKKAILGGIVILASSFFAGIFIGPHSPELIMYPIFILAGIGWATINVNSFPMVVELARGGHIGKYTGYYYTASMAAQIVAPILSGVLFDLFGMKYIFFAFGTVFVTLSLITMLFVKHGDSKPLAKKNTLEHLDVDN